MTEGRGYLGSCMSRDSQRLVSVFPCPRWWLSWNGHGGDWLARGMQFLSRVSSASGCLEKKHTTWQPITEARFLRKGNIYVSTKKENYQMKTNQENHQAYKWFCMSDRKATDLQYILEGVLLTWLF